MYIIIKGYNIYIIFAFISCSLPVSFPENALDKFFWEQVQALDQIVQMF